MRQRFKARELWLFAPFLLIIAGALYWTRVEQVSKPGASAMFVSDFKVEDAPGYYQERGFSHQVVTKVSHPWPRPRWWGKDFSQVGPVNALDPTNSPYVINGVKEDYLLSEGIALTVDRAGKSVALPSSYVDNPLHFKFDGSNYVFTNYLKLSEIPPTQSAVRLRGACFIAGQPHFAFQGVVRKVGETVVMRPNKDPHAQLVSIAAKDNEQERDAVYIAAVLRRDKDNGKDQILCPVYDLNIVDSQGKVWPVSYDNDTWVSLSITYIGVFGEERDQLKRDEFMRFLMLTVGPKSKAQPPLKLRGKISVDDGWPIPFEVKLPKF